MIRRVEELHQDPNSLGGRDLSRAPPNNRHPSHSIVSPNKTRQDKTRQDKRSTAACYPIIFTFSILDIMHLLRSLLVATTTLATIPVVFSWLPHSGSHFLSMATSPARTPSALQSTEKSEESEVPDYTGKTIYQRTFYRLSPGSTVSKPNALILEERLRFQPDPNNPGYILPKGPRTLILRKGTHEDRITDELYRIQLGHTDHNGPGTMDTAIATMLFLASNPELVQGDVLELACEEGAAALVGCIGAKFAMDPAPKAQEDLEIMTVPKHKDVFPKRMHHLTISDEGEDGIRAAYDIVKGFLSGEVSLKDVCWSRRTPGRRYDHYYRLVLGSDIDFTYPSARELARTVANYLLPSNEFAVATVKGAAGSSAGSFGALGMDMAAPSSHPPSDPERAIDPKIPATFVHVCPDTRENTMYLRQFLEKGFRMTVNTGYLKMERLQFVFQALPEDAPESDIEDLDLELKDERYRSYQSLTAMHHPDYAGEGSGEYFFPLETGEYEGGSRTTYLEPEEGGSPW